MVPWTRVVLPSASDTVTCQVHIPVSGTPSPVVSSVLVPTSAPLRSVRLTATIEPCSEAEKIPLGGSDSSLTDTLIGSGRGRRVCRSIGQWVAAATGLDTRTTGGRPIVPASSIDALVPPPAKVNRCWRAPSTGHDRSNFTPTATDWPGWRVPAAGMSENGEPAPRNVRGPDVADQLAGEPPVFDSVTEADVEEVPKSIDDDDRLSAAGGGGGGGGGTGGDVVVVVAGAGGATVVVTTGGAGAGAGMVVVATAGAAADRVVVVTTLVWVVDVVELGRLLVVVVDVELGEPAVVVVVGEDSVVVEGELGASADDAGTPAMAAMSSFGAPSPAGWSDAPDGNVVGVTVAMAASSFESASTYTVAPIASNSAAIPATTARANFLAWRRADGKPPGRPNPYEAAPPAVVAGDGDRLAVAASTRSRRPAGAANAGAPANSASGASARRARSQMSQASMCRATRLRMSTVNCSSHPREDLGQLGAVLAATAGDAVGSEAAFGALPHPVQQVVALLGCHAECVREVGAVEPLPQAQLQHELVSFVEPAGCGAHQGCELVELGAGRGTVVVGGQRHLSDRFREVGGDGAPLAARPSVHLVAQDGEQPRLQARRVAELPQPLGGDHDDVLDDVGRVVTVVGHRRGGVVERCPVPVVDAAERGAIAREVRGDELGIGDGRHGA